MEPSTIDIVSTSVFSDALLTDGDAATATLLSAADGGALRPRAAALVADRGASQIVQFLNVTPIWEFALVAAAVLIIGVLIGARLIEALSNRDLDIDPMAALSSQETDDETDEPADDEPAHTYEAYISPDTPDELLSDRGQIIRILVENDGRTYQYRIVEETGWSKSKVSRLLSEMHERGEIGKVSVGRENAIVLADHGPDGSDQADDPSVAVKKSPQ
ncbi:MarR family transcriptional regulator [Natronococcus pandeyae]|uniref:MarR family transcriptional regulator n=1 Tax=Natronococcus pandeyae TaxID=2055836 RepID=A0A8J8Q5S4_9EURY|nr:MarR family transcriptional regulator [Natronococcus pandeyae]TYL39499.1 MarR family transcriptional regulator [Natronococcus pandeyae]